MSEKNINTEEFDLMMKSVLGEAQEEVPERVWEGVSAGLDKAAGRRTVVLRFRRAAIGAAAAAAVILGVFFMHNIEDEFVPAAEGSGMIAVAEPVVEAATPAEEVAAPVEERVEDEPETFILLAEAKETETETAEAVEEAGEEIDEVMEAAVPETAADAIETAGKKSGSYEKEAEEYFPADWGEEEKGEKRDIALVLSGITGTNNSRNGNRMSMMMRPEANPAPKRTGIEETSSKSSYGIPLSFGAGVKIGLSGRWSLGAGVNYTFLSRQFYGKYTKVDDAGNIERVISSDILNQQHYIGIPVNVFYDVVSNDRISFYAYAGGTAEKCLSDSYHLLNTSINHKEKAEGIQLSANAGIGVEFMLGKHLGLYIDPSIRYYFDNGQPKSIRTVQPMMFGFEIGFRARL